MTCASLDVYSKREVENEYEEMAIYILEYCDTWHSMDEIAQFANRDKNYIRNKVLPKLAEKLEKERQNRLSKTAKEKS